jgi:hypothetical protein
MVCLETIASQELLDGSCSYTFRVLRQAVLFIAIAYSSFEFFFCLVMVTGKTCAKNHNIFLVQVVEVVEIVKIVEAVEIVEISSRCG